MVMYKVYFVGYFSWFDIYFDDKYIIVVKFVFDNKILGF